MGLDKWLKPEGEVIEERREKKGKKDTVEDVSKPIKKKYDTHLKEPVENIKKKLSKFELVCSNRKCKYQKIILKKNITEKDKNCPKCSSVMKVR